MNEYVHRTMEADFSDLVWHETRRGTDLPDVGLMRKEDPMLRHLAIVTISGNRSWLMPCCVTFVHAQMWYSRANASARKKCGHLLRMKTEKIGLDIIIDLSSHAAQKAFFRDNLEIWGEEVRANHFYLKRAIANGEALLMWRGRVNTELMEVVDVDRGQFLMPRSIAAGLCSENWGAVAHESSESFTRLVALPDR